MVLGSGFSRFIYYGPTGSGSTTLLEISDDLHSDKWQMCTSENLLRKKRKVWLLSFFLYFYGQRQRDDNFYLLTYCHDLYEKYKKYPQFSNYACVLTFTFCTKHSS
jgi:hypothetical protein